MSYKKEKFIGFINIHKQVKDTATRLLDTQFANTALAATFDADGDLESGIAICADRKTFFAIDLPTPDDNVTNGLNHVDMYKTDGATIFIESGDNDTLGIWPYDATIRDYFDNWDFCDLDPATGLAQFGLNPENIEAKGDDTNVRIWISAHDSYRGDFARDDNYEIIEFATYEEAENWLTMIYACSFNYSIVK